MSGYECNRFIDLSEREAKHLICSICLNIYNNAVKSECEHTFCKSCVENWIKSNRRECPECRTGFTRKRTSSMTSDINLVIVSNFVFKKNLTANNMINEFKIKCDNESNGCPEVVELTSLSEHFKNCEHWLCPKCQFIDKYEGHDCFERMKTEKNHLIVKLNEIQSKNTLLEEKIKNNEKKFNESLNEMKAKNKRLEEKLINKTNEIESKNSLLEEEIKTIKRLEVGANNKLKDIESKLKSSEIKNLKLENELNENNLKVWSQNLKNVWKKETTLSAQSIYFGTYLSPYSTIKFSFNFRNTLIDFEINPKNSEDYENYTDFSFSIRAIEEFKFCADSEFPIIIIKFKSLKFSNKIREIIKLSEPSKGWFDFESKDIKERYITIKVCPQTTIGYIIIGYLMSVTGHIGTPLKCQSIDLNEAKHMFNSVSNNWFNEDSDSDTNQNFDSEEEEISPISSLKGSVNFNEWTPIRHPENKQKEDQYKSFAQQLSSYFNQWKRCPEGVLHRGVPCRGHIVPPNHRNAQKAGQTIEKSSQGRIN